MPEIEIEITRTTVCNGKTVYVGDEITTDKRQADLLIKSDKAKIAGVTLAKLEARAERKLEEAAEAEAVLQKARDEAVKEDHKAKEEAAKEKAEADKKAKAKAKSNKDKEE